MVAHAPRTVPPKGAAPARHAHQARHLSVTPPMAEKESHVRGVTPTRLEELPNVGPKTAAKLELVGVRTPEDLAGRDPYALFGELCARTGERCDPCLLDVLVAATRFLEGEPARPWWAYTGERKARLEQAQQKLG